jgi:hypothetical protein
MKVGVSLKYTIYLELLREFVIFRFFCAPLSKLIEAAFD